jgi:hypothetical protein
MMPSTRWAFIEIEAMIDAGYKTIIPAFLAFNYGRAATSRAIREAVKRGLIEVAYVAVSGARVYRPAGVRRAIKESSGQVRR